MDGVWTFFYGSYMNLEVLAGVDVVPEQHAVASLPGFELTIRPRANLLRSADATAFGIVARVTHAELERLYAHARDVLGEVYLPEAVLVGTREGSWLPALCYLAPRMEDRPAERAYVERIAAPAERLGFPAGYVARIRAFAPA